MTNEILHNDAMKKCIYCAEDVKEEAVKCKYCGGRISKDFILMRKKDGIKAILCNIISLYFMSLIGVLIFAYAIRYLNNK